MGGLFSIRGAGGSLAELHRLEWRYDGPIPAEALSTLDVAPAALARRRGAADAALVDGLVRDAVRSLAAARRRTAAAELRHLEQHGATTGLIAYRRSSLARRAADFPPV
jgi:hypothetical protein